MGCGWFNEHRRLFGLRKPISIDEIPFHHHKYEPTNQKTRNFFRIKSVVGERKEDRIRYLALHAHNEIKEVHIKRLTIGSIN